MFNPNKPKHNNAADQENGFRSLGDDVPFQGSKNFSQEVVCNADKAAKLAEERAAVLRTAEAGLKLASKSSSYRDVGSGEEHIIPADPERVKKAKGAYYEASVEAKKAQAHAEWLNSVEGQEAEQKRLKREYEEAQKRDVYFMRGCTPNDTIILQEYERRISEATNERIRTDLKEKMNKYEDIIVMRGKEIVEKEHKEMKERRQGINNVESKRRRGGLFGPRKHGEATDAEESIEKKLVDVNPILAERFERSLNEIEEKARATKGIPSEAYTGALEAKIKNGNCSSKAKLRISKAIELLSMSNRSDGGLNQCSYREAREDYRADFAKELFTLQEKINNNKDRKQNKLNKKILKNALGVKKLPEDFLDEKFMKKVSLMDLQEANGHIRAKDKNGEPTAGWAKNYSSFNRNLPNY